MKLCSLSLTDVGLEYTVLNMKSLRHLELGDMSLVTNAVMRCLLASPTLISLRLGVFAGVVICKSNTVYSLSIIWRNNDMNSL